MPKNTREANIRRIIELEDRICQCRRCQGLITCVRKPSLGKGDLDPEVVLVFESENAFTADLNNLIELRSIIKKEFGIDKIYHTFMVRCKPKSCSVRQSTNYYVEGKLIDVDSKCLLTGRGCDGIPIRPLTEEIISCLSYILEEINILKPRYTVLFGDRVSEFILKSFGVFDNLDSEVCFQANDMAMFTTVYEKDFDSYECQKLNRYRIVRCV